MNDVVDSTAAANDLLPVRGNCRFWVKGTCRYGPSCWFFHEHPRQQQFIQPHSRSPLTPPPQYSKNLAPHRIIPLPVIPPPPAQSVYADQHRAYASRNNASSSCGGPAGPSSRSVCRYWLQGICNRGPACRFLHGAAAPAAGTVPADFHPQRHYRNVYVMRPSAPRPRPRSTTFDGRHVLPAGVWPISPADPRHQQQHQHHHHHHQHVARLRAYTYPPGFPSPQSDVFAVGGPQACLVEDDQGSVEDYGLPFDFDEWDDFGATDAVREPSHKPVRNLREIWNDEKVGGGGAVADANPANAAVAAATDRCQSVWSGGALPPGLQMFDSLTL